MLPKEINFGPLTIHFYGLIIGLALFLGWALAKKNSHLYKIPEKIFDEPVSLIPIILSVIGARIYHVIDYWSLYREDLISALYINRGGLGILGAVAGGIAGIFLVAKIKKLDFLSILDLVSPSMLLGQSLGRVGNFINQEGFGPPTEKPWGIFISPENRPLQYKEATQFHPTFFYEAALDAIFFIILLTISKKFKKPGSISGLYLILYSTGRFIVEFWRIDTATFGMIKAAHIFTVAAFIVGTYLFISSQKRG